MSYLYIGYVYTLSFEGNIFYIGSTKHPSQRLQEHLYCQDLCTGRLMHWIRYMGKTPDVKLVFSSTDCNEVAAYEYKLIYHYRDIRHPLCNVDGNRPQNVIQMPSIKDMPRHKFSYQWRKELTKYIKEYQLTAKNSINNEG